MNMNEVLFLFWKPLYLHSNLINLILNLCGMMRDCTTWHVVTALSFLHIPGKDYDSRWAFTALPFHIFPGKIMTLEKHFLGLYVCTRGKSVYMFGTLVMFSFFNNTLLTLHYTNSLTEKLLYRAQNHPTRMNNKFTVWCIHG